MGTPVTFIYATKILTTFAPNLIYYKQYIDDIFGIWLPPTHNKDSTWAAFTNTLNSWGKLKWVIPKSTFLDLNISIDNTRIVTTTYQKELNLCLYILPCSAHPPSCL
jgi:hypothetical protein